MQMRFIRRLGGRLLAAYLPAAVLFLPASGAWAVGSSGFENATLSTRTLARANAAVADPEEPSTIVFNPAGLSRLERREVYFGSNLILPAYSYRGIKALGSENASETLIPVPFAYASMPLPDPNWTFGVGANSPFGLITKYSSTGPFSYIAYYNDLKTMAYETALSYRINERMSVGGGWTLMDVTLKQVGKFNRTLVAGTPGDAPFEYAAEGQGQGWRAGFLWDVSPSDTLGVSYRSEVRAHLKGTMSTHELSGILGVVFGSGDSNVTSVDTDYSFPSNVTIGWDHRWSDKFDTEIDLGWTGWSSYDTFDTVFGTSNAVLAGFEHLGKDFGDALSVHTGSSLKLGGPWTFLSGYYFQQMAANKNNYTNEIPDGDRHGVSAGFEYSHGDWTLDFNYLAAFTARLDIENTAGNSNNTDIDGEYHGFLQSWTVGFRRKF